MARRPDPTSATEVGLRLKITRSALGLTTTTMCRLMGSTTSGSAYSNYEMGRRMISIEYALALCAKCRLTLPWIYQGQVDTLPADIREKVIVLLGDADQAAFSTQRSKRSRVG